ncbi:MAG: hypothetical protein ACP5I1_21245, partial [Candidatus Hinthialibacter sp.]
VHDMLIHFTSLADMAGGQLDTLLEVLHHAAVMVEDIQGSLPGEKITQEADSSQPAPNQEKVAEIGMNPENHDAQAQKASMP